MADHKLAKLMLEQASTFLERTEAIETARYLGMPLYEIEEYLDWLDMLRSRQGDDSIGDEPVPARRRRTAG